MIRIGLLGDTHGHVPALEASIRGCREAGVDLVVHCGDFINTPFSPDPDATQTPGGWIPESIRGPRMRQFMHGQ